VGTTGQWGSYMGTLVEKLGILLGFAQPQSKKPSCFPGPLGISFESFSKEKCKRKRDSASGAARGPLANILGIYFILGSHFKGCHHPFAFALLAFSFERFFKRWQKNLGTKGTTQDAQPHTWEYFWILLYFAYSHSKACCLLWACWKFFQRFFWAPRLPSPTRVPDLGEKAEVRQL